jgi:hypothetical protein
MMVLFAELTLFRGELKGGGTGIVDVADDLERLYKNWNLMQHKTRRNETPGNRRISGVLIP